MTTQGYGVADIFHLKSDHTQIQKVDRSTTATALADKLYRIGDLSGNEIAESFSIKPEEGKATVSITHIGNNPLFTAFHRAAAPKKVGAASSSTPEINSIAGKKIGGVSASSDAVHTLGIYYGYYTDTKVQVFIMAHIFKPTTGGLDVKYNEYGKPITEAESVANKAAISVPAALFDSTIVTVSTAQSVPKDEYCYEVWLDRVV